MEEFQEGNEQIGGMGKGERGNCPGGGISSMEVNVGTYVSQKGHRGGRGPFGRPLIRPVPGLVEFHISTKVPGLAASMPGWRVTLGLVGYSARLVTS